MVQLLTTLSLCAVIIITSIRVSAVEEQIKEVKVEASQAEYMKAWEDGREATIQAVVVGACDNHEDQSKCINHFTTIVSNLESKGSDE